MVVIRKKEERFRMGDEVVLIPKFAKSEWQADLQPRNTLTHISESTVQRRLPNSLHCTSLGSQCSGKHTSIITNAANVQDSYLHISSAELPSDDCEFEAGTYSWVHSKLIH